MKRIQIGMGRGGRGGVEVATGCSTGENLARAGP